MSTTIDDDVTAETPQKPTSRQRRAASIADAASGGMKMLLVKIVALGILDAIAVYALFVLVMDGEWLIAAVVAVVAAVVNWIYFSRRKLPAKYLTPGIIFLVLFQVFVLVYTGYIAFTNYGTGHNGSQGAGGLVAHGLVAAARRGLADLPRDGRRPRSARSACS